MPTDNEFKTLGCFVQVMKPFVDITEALGAEKWATISALTPLFPCLDQSHVIVSEFKCS